MDVRRGYRGDLVRQVQNVLIAHDSYQGRLDGYFGPKTEAAVRAWQTDIGVPITGRWDPLTNARTQVLLSTGPVAALMAPTARRK